MLALSCSAKCLCFDENHAINWLRHEAIYIFFGTRKVFFAHVNKSMFNTVSRSTSMRYFFAETKSLKSQRPVTQDLKKSIWQRYSNFKYFSVDSVCPNIVGLSQSQNRFHVGSEYDKIRSAHAEHILKVNRKLVAIPPYAEHAWKLVTLWPSRRENHARVDSVSAITS
jgi:hypothetical protein